MMILSRVLLALLALLAGAAPAHAATVDPSGTWSFTPKGGRRTTIEVPGGGWVKQGHERVAEATYERSVTVPRSATGQVVELFLERVNHEATLFVDGKE